MRPPVPSGTVFVKDPVDVWGKEQTIGLAEHAVRTHAAPMPFDRRGDVIYWDDFESPTRKYIAYTGTVNRSADRSYNGDFSLKCVSTGSGPPNRDGFVYYLANIHNDTNIGLQFAFSTDDDMWRMRIGMTYYDTVDKHMFIIGLKSDGTLQYWDSAGTWQDIATTSLYKQNSYIFAMMKVVGDLSTNKYVRATVFNAEYDLSSYACQTVASVKPEPYLSISGYVEELDAASKTVYFDNLILTENEPA